MIVASLYSILNKIFDLAPPLLIGAAVDTVFQQQNSFIARLGVSDVGNQLLVMAVLTVVIWFFESLFQYLYQVTWRRPSIRAGDGCQLSVRVVYFDNVDRLRMSNFEKGRTK